MKDVFIVAAKRTPVGSFRGALSPLSAPILGGISSKAALAQAKNPEIDEVYYGQVLTSGVGQAPVTQMARHAGLPPSVPCTLVNKVCASGLKSVMLGALSIQTGENHTVLAGGMESMSNVPYLLEKSRAGFGYGHQKVTDGIIHDGLWDAQYQIHMGQCAEETAKNFGISRQEQDEFAIKSYQRAAEAVQNGWFKEEIAPVTISGKKEITVTEDEEYKKVDFQKVPKLKPVFIKDGTVTAANASTLNDGASSVVLMSESKLKSSSVKPLAKILRFADSNRDPKEFTIAPADAVKKLLNKTGVKKEEIKLWEINEAFSVVVLANCKLLDLSIDKVNIAGGGVSLGHPIGSSGCRILVSLIHLLKPGEIGCVAICNGGGGASAMLIQRL